MLHGPGLADFEHDGARISLSRASAGPGYSTSGYRRAAYAARASCWGLIPIFQGLGFGREFQGLVGTHACFLLAMLFDCLLAGPGSLPAHALALHLRSLWRTC